MYELIQLSTNTYCIESPTKIGLVRLSENEVCLIDSGNDKDAGRKVRQILEANHWTLKAIYHQRRKTTSFMRWIQDGNP